MTDAGLSAFSVFFMQSPSFLEFQQTMQETQGKNNLQTLFGVLQIPADNPIRRLLDTVEPAAVYLLFDFLFDGFQRSGVVDSFRTADNRLLPALVGLNTFHHKSYRVHAVHARRTATAKIGLPAVWQSNLYPLTIINQATHVVRAYKIKPRFTSFKTNA